MIDKKKEIINERKIIKKELQRFHKMIQKKINTYNDKYIKYIRC